MSGLKFGRKPAQSGKARSVVVFLHGYGADGADLLGLGDALAHKVAIAIKQLQLYIQTQLQQLEQATVELAQDELALSPTQAEMNQFSRDVSQLQARLDVLSRHNAFRQE